VAGLRAPVLRERIGEEDGQNRPFGGTCGSGEVLVAVGMLMPKMLVVVEAGTAGATFPGHNGKLKG
jgi:hypothetical protein